MKPVQNGSGYTNGVLHVLDRFTVYRYEVDVLFLPCVALTMVFGSVANKTKN